MSLPPTHGRSVPPNPHAPLFRQRGVDVARRPSEPERRRTDANADRAVSTVGATVRIGAGHELAGIDQSLFGKIEVKDAVARRRVIRRLDAVTLGELPADRRLMLVGITSGEHEVIVGDRRLPRRDQTDRP